MNELNHLARRLVEQSCGETHKNSLAPQIAPDPQNSQEGTTQSPDRTSPEEPLQGISIGSMISYHIPGENEQGPFLVGRIDSNWGMLQVCTPNGWTWINPCVVIKVDQEAGE